MTSGPHIAPLREQPQEAASWDLPACDVSAFALLAEASGDILFSLASDQEHIQWQKDVASSLLGFEPGSMAVTAASFPTLVADPDRQAFQDAWARLLAKTPTTLEFRMVRHDGRMQWVQMIALESPDQPGRIVGLLRDTQARHEEKEALAEARRQETIGTMAGGIAHEFNNHLTPIRGYIELALDYLGEGHPVSEGLQTALNRVEYCTQLVSQIQAYGQQSFLRKERLQIGALLPSIIRVALSTEPEQAERITLDRKWPDALPPVSADRGQFQQAISHLIQNALNAMPQGGHLSVHVEEKTAAWPRALSLRQKKPGTYLCIAISDTGRGIHPDHLDHIFEPFFSANGRSGSRGMGLPMVQGMAAQHDGWVDVRSQVGQGTTVELYLPTLPTEESASDRDVDADGTMSVLPAAQIGRMYIADDEESIRLLIGKIFDAEGWEVDSGGDYDEVYEEIVERKTPYDLLVLDIMMPGRGAEETVSRIADLFPDIKIIFISGHTKDARIEKLMEKTHSTFISKPFSPRDLLTAVDSIMAG